MPNYIIKTTKYAKSCIFIEKCIKYYNDYQILLNKTYYFELKDKNMELSTKINTKDKKINNLEEKINNMLKSNDKMMK